jgi:hypothetical protein
MSAQSCDMPPGQMGLLEARYGHTVAVRQSPQVGQEPQQNPNIDL